MKKLIALLLALMMLIGMTACQSENKKKDDDKSDSNSAATQQEEQGQTEEPQTQEEEPNPPAEPIGLDLTLNAPNHEYEVATLTLFPDFTFEMTINLLEGFGMVKGSYTINDQQIACTLTDKTQLQGFTGEELETFYLQPVKGGGYLIIFNGVAGIGALKDRTTLYQ